MKRWNQQIQNLYVTLSLSGNLRGNFRGSRVQGVNICNTCCAFNAIITHATSSSSISLVHCSVHTLKTFITAPDCFYHTKHIFPHIFTSVWQCVIWALSVYQNWWYKSQKWFNSRYRQQQVCQCRFKISLTHRRILRYFLEY